MPIPKISGPLSASLSLSLSFSLPLAPCSLGETNENANGRERMAARTELLLPRFSRPILVDATPNAENRGTRTGARQQNVPAALSPRLPSTYISYFFPASGKIRFRGCLSVFLSAYNARLRVRAHGRASTHSVVLVVRYVARVCGTTHLGTSHYARRKEVEATERSASRRSRLKDLLLSFSPGTMDGPSAIRLFGYIFSHKRRNGGEGEGLERAKNQRGGRVKPSQSIAN